LKSLIEQTKGDKVSSLAQQEASMKQAFSYRLVWGFSRDIAFGGLAGTRLPF
jgi:hypothetical protein